MEANRITRIVFSCSELFLELCVEELKGSFPNGKFERWIIPGTGIFTADGFFCEISERISASKPMFLHHIFPLDYECETPSDIIGGIKDRLNPGSSFAVQLQTESFSDKKQQMIHELSDEFVAAGFTLDISEPVQVISVIVTERGVYAGLSDAKFNLSKWPGGKRRFSKEYETISRASFKLLEAIETFSLDFGTAEFAADLGAAPGGWTKVLLDLGLNVVCVDPAELDPRVARDSRVEHFKGLAEDFVKTASSSFDLVVNDVRMDVFDSVRIMLDIRAVIKDGGMIIMTFKLPMKKRKQQIRKGLELLSEGFEVLYAKQLFHNRSEITVVARKHSV